MTAVFAHDDGRALAEAFARLDGDARRVVVLTDVPEAVATRTSALRRFLAAERPVTTIVTIDRGDAVPAFCRSVLEVGSAPVPAGVIPSMARSAPTGSMSPGSPPTRPARSDGTSPACRTPRIPLVQGPS